MYLFVCFTAINASIPSDLNSPIKSPEYQDIVTNDDNSTTFFTHPIPTDQYNHVLRTKISLVNEDKDDEEICREEDSGMGVFRCGQCDKAFPQKSILQLHICTRTPNKPFECGCCGNAFANPNDLRAHSAVHCNEKPFKCGYCSRAFSGATTLNNHIRTHTGEKPFNCQKCSRTFSQGAQLSRHQRIECKHVSGSEVKCS